MIVELFKVNANIIELTLTHNYNIRMKKVFIFSEKYLLFNC